MKKLLMLAFVSFSTVAFADAVPPGPPDCPAGSTSESSHDGMWCAPSTCSASSPCSDGLKCAQAGLCVATVKRTSSGRRPSGTPPSTYETQVATGACNTQADCAAGMLTSGQCVTVERCVPSAWVKPKPPPPAIVPPTNVPDPAPASSPTRTPETKAEGASCAASSSAAIAALAAILVARRRRS